jgi:hypothetical protein
MAAPDTCNAGEVAHLSSDPYTDQTKGTLLKFGVLNGKIVNIQTTNPTFATAVGIRVGSTMAQTQAAYPTAQTSTDIYGQPVVTLANGAGRVLRFYMGGPNQTVGNITVAESLSTVATGSC